jgi:hypothetical protein
MYRISKKTHAVLILVTILLLYSCNYIFDKKDSKDKNQIGKERVAMSKEQAKLLVDTSRNVVDVIDICEVVENLKVAEQKKIIISNLKKNQIEILNEIKIASSAVMISVPYNTRKPEQKIAEDSLFFEEKVHLIDFKINKQKELVSVLKSKTSNEIILELTDTITPLIDDNLETLNTLAINSIKTEQITNSIKSE